jgi:hypothetical protein
VDTRLVLADVFSDGPSGETLGMEQGYLRNTQLGSCRPSKPLPLARGRLQPGPRRVADSLALLLGDPGDDRMRPSPTRVVVSSMGAAKDLNFTALEASCSRYRRVLSGPSLFHSLSPMCFLDPPLESPGRTPVSEQLGCLPHPCQRCPLSATGRSASAREPISPNPLRASTDAEVSSSCASGHQR